MTPPDPEDSGSRQATQRFARIKQILIEVEGLTGPDREAHIDISCGGDDELRAEVQALLAHEPPAAPPAAEGTPTRIGSYEILDELGRGGMGIVYLAKDTRLDRTIAIKVLSKEFAEDPESFVRFEREAQLLAVMDHPHIATVYSLEEEDGRHFLTMEHVQGRTLSERIKQGTLGLDRALPIARQIAAALESAHNRGAIHRDLQPGNVMITPDGRVKVLDFGLAKSISMPTEVTTAGTVMGTPGYMSPEQLRGEPTGVATDIWAFGCLLFACVTGRSPFQMATAMESIAATLRSEPEWSQLPADLPSEFLSLLQRCLAKPPENRPATMKGVRQAIDALSNHGFVELPAGTGSRCGEAVMSNPKADHNIPPALSSLLGREAELQRLDSLLDRERIVTVVGAGGCGKTRIALELALRRLGAREQGPWFVELADLNDPSLVCGAVANLLKISVVEGDDPLDAIATLIGRGPMLLILDNAEHVVAPCRELVTVLARSCSGLRVLTTSQVPMGIEGEAVFPLAPLPTSGPGLGFEEVRSNPAVQLFVERAAAVDPSFELTVRNSDAVSEICRRLDGLPLAIELAAARTNVFTPAEIASRLDQRFRILTAGRKSSSPRHRTLRGMIDWSYDLLGDKEKAVLRRLAVFAGSWTLEAAEAVCAGGEIEEWEVLEVFTTLLEKSLVHRVREPSGAPRPTRYRMLDSVRAYARERLEQSSETDVAVARHRSFFTTFAESGSHLRSGVEAGSWFQRLADDHENLRAAILSSAGLAGAAEDGLRLAGSLITYWTAVSRHVEGVELGIQVLANPGAQERTELRRQALYSTGLTAYTARRLSVAREFLEECLDIAIAHGDARNIARGKESLAIVLADSGNDGEAERLLESSLADNRRIGNRDAVASSLHNLAAFHYQRGNLELAQRCVEESLSLASPEGSALPLHNFGMILGAAGKPKEAVEKIEQSISLYRRSGYRSREASAYTNLAGFRSELGDIAGAWSSLSKARDLWNELGETGELVTVLHHAAALLARTGRTEPSIIVLGFAKQANKRAAESLSSFERQCLNGLDESDRQDSVQKLLHRGQSLSLDAAVDLAFSAEPTESGGDTLGRDPESSGSSGSE